MLCLAGREAEFLFLFFLNQNTSVLIHRKIKSSWISKCVLKLGLHGKQLP